jgi:RecA-family ATPase
MYLSIPEEKDLKRRECTVNAGAQLLPAGVTLIHFYDAQGNSPLKVALQKDEVDKFIKILQLSKKRPDLGEMLMFSDTTKTTKRDQP